VEGAERQQSVVCDSELSELRCGFSEVSFETASDVLL